MEPPSVQSPTDLISGLSDDLLHAILLRLPSITAAARTSILSRRWRRVWTAMPELDFGGGRPAPAPASTNTSAALLDSIDAALDSYSAPTLRRLKIDLKELEEGHDLPSHRVARWLGFASNRLAGKLYIHLHWPNYAKRPVDVVTVTLPVCERATEIELGLSSRLVIRLPSTGSFAALTDLKIMSTQMDGGELGRVVSTQCPRLRNLVLVCIRLVATRDVSIRSESLECLNCCVETTKLEVTAPMLLEIAVLHAKEAYIVAPKLEKVEWTGSYYPDRHQFVVAPRRLRSLAIMYSTWIGWRICSNKLIQRFDTASELGVSLGLLKGIAGYFNFLKDMDKLPVCETLRISIIMNNHALAPMMLHLLRRSSSIRKLELSFNWQAPSEMAHCTASSCPCFLQESYRVDDINFDSLEEIRIFLFTGSTEEEELLKLLLSRCNMVTLKRVELRVPSGPSYLAVMEVVERIRSMCCPNSNVQFNVITRDAPKPLPSI